MSGSVKSRGTSEPGLGDGDELCSHSGALTFGVMRSPSVHRSPPLTRSTVKLGENKPLPLQRVLVTEVDQVTDGLPRDSHVIDDLCFMFGQQIADSFELDD